MKNLTFILLITILMSCSSEEQSVEVSLIGTWYYIYTTQNSPCDGIEAKGIVIYTSLNGDLAKLGDTTTQGETFGFNDTTNCIFTTIDTTSSSAQGDPSVLTYSQFKNNFDTNIAKDSNIVTGRVENFSNTNITEVTEYINGYIITFSMSR